MAPGSGRPPSGTWWTMWSMTLCAKFSPTINRHRQRRRTASAWTQPRKCVCLFMTCFWFYFCIKLQTKPLFHLVTTRAGHTNLFAKLLQVTLWGWCGFYLFIYFGLFFFFCENFIFNIQGLKCNCKTTTCLFFELFTILKDNLLITKVKDISLADINIQEPLKVLER